MSKILHFIVNYQNNDQTQNLIDNFNRIRGHEEVELVVINNSALDVKDNVFSVQGKNNSKFSVINFPDNPGYFNGADRACSRFNPLDYEYTVLSNSDIEFLNEDFYQNLIDLSLDESVGAVAPSIISDLTKKESNPLYLKRPKKTKIKLLQCIYSFYILAWLYHLLSWVKNRFVKSKSILSDRAVIYALHGAFIIMRKNFFQKGGSFKYPVKLYGEEIFLAEVLKKMNLKTVFVKSLNLSHKEKGTEKSWLARYTLSYRTFLFKKESSSYIKSVFDQGSS